jgi:hypothetical protein
VLLTLRCAQKAYLRKYCRGEGYSRVAAATAAQGFNIAGGRGLGTLGCCQTGLAWGGRASRGSRCCSGLGLQGGRSATRRSPCRLTAALKPAAGVDGMKC